MKHKKSAFKDCLLSVPLDSRHLQTGATLGQTVTSLCLMLTSQDVLGLFVLFDSLHPSQQFFSLFRSSWVEPELSKDKCVLFKDTTQ